MAFPVRESLTNTPFNTDTTQHLVAMPATVNAGDLLLCLLTHDAQPNLTTPADWTNIYNSAGSTFRIRGYAKVAVGDEGGTTVDFVTASGEQMSAQVYRYSNWFGSLAGVVVGTIATGGDAPADPPSLSPGWTEDTVWVLHDGYSATSNQPTAAPTNYGNFSNQVTTGPGSSAAGSATATRDLNAASEDPGTFTHSGTHGWAAQTIAIRPAAVNVNLAGNQPAATGALTVQYRVLGSQPAPSGTLAVLQSLLRSLAGVQPAATGILTNDFAPEVLVGGEQPAASGALSLRYNVSLAGNQPSATGSLSEITTEGISGNQPAGSGTLAVFQPFVNLAGNQPAATGRLAIFFENLPGLSFITIHEPDGTLFAEGLTPLNYKISRFLNRIGSWSVEMPVDEIVGLLPVPRQIGAGWKVGILQENNNPLHGPDEGYLLWQGVVETRQHKFTPGGQSTLALTGSMRTLAMVRRTIGRGATYSPNLATFTNAMVGDLLGANGSAILPVHAGTTTFYGNFHIEYLSRYQAFLKGLAQARYAVRDSWDHDRPELVRQAGAPSPPVVLRKLYDGEDRYLHENGATGVGLIAGEPVVRYDGTQIVNRIIAYGSDTVVDPADSTKTMTVNLTLASANLGGPYTVQSALNPDGSPYYYIEDAASIARYGLSELTLIRTDIKNPNDDPTDRIQAADVLYWTAVNEMIRRRSEKVVVTIGPIANGAHIWLLPGDAVWTQYQGKALTEDGEAIWLDLEKRFLVAERHDESHPSGVRRVEFVLVAPEMEFALGDLPPIRNPFVDDPEDPDYEIPDFDLPPMPPYPDNPFLPDPEVPEPDLPPEEEQEQEEPGSDNTGLTLPVGILRLTEDDVLEYWDGSAWQNVEARLGTTDPGGGALWQEPP